MWFRVELHKDGSVAACETVEGKLKDGKHVFYVEADTKERALADVKRRYIKELEQRREFARRVARERAAVGQCRASSCRAAAALGYAFCEEHRAKERARARAEWARKKAGDMAPKKTIEERALRRTEGKKASWGDHYSRVKEKHGMTPTALYQRRAALTDALAAYDADPVTFRAWLVTKLALLGVNVAEDKREPFAFEAAAE